MISPEPWDHIFVSKHHYAATLAKRGNKVFFLNPPGKKYEMKQTEFCDVFAVDYKGFPRGLRFYPSILQKYIITWMYNRLTRLCSTEFDIIWSFDNSVFYDFSALPSAGLKISHIVDFNQNFQMQKAATSADVCFCTTGLIKANLERHNSKVYKINHGFNPSMVKKGSVSGPSNEGIRVIYAGNLSIPYIDWSLVLEVVHNFSEVQFLFLGSNNDVEVDDRSLRESKRKVMHSANVVFGGCVDANELQEYYQSADVLLVAYHEKYHSGQADNPHKIMEYLGSGKVVLATHTSEYLGLSPLIVMSNKNSEWPDLFRAVIGNLEYYNSDQLQARRVAFAMDNTYEKQICKIERIINGE